MNKAFSESTYFSNGMLCITPKKAQQLCNWFAYLVDLRMPYLNDFKKFNVKQIICIPYNRFNAQITSLSKEKYLILADTSNTQSAQAYNTLKENGFEHMAILSGGFIEWERDDLPILVDTKKQLSGSCVCQLKKRNN